MPVLDSKQFRATIAPWSRKLRGWLMALYDARRAATPFHVERSRKDSFHRLTIVKRFFKFAKVTIRPRVFLLENSPSKSHNWEWIEARNSSLFTKPKPKYLLIDDPEDVFTRSDGDVLFFVSVKFHGQETPPDDFDGRYELLYQAIMKYVALRESSEWPRCTYLFLNLLRWELGLFVGSVILLKALWPGSAAVNFGIIALFALVVVLILSLPHGLLSLIRSNIEPQLISIVDMPLAFKQLVYSKSLRDRDHLAIMYNATILLLTFLSVFLIIILS